MSTKRQTFENHTRRNPLYHYIASPLTTLYWLYATVLAFRNPSTDAVIHALWAFGIVATTGSLRLHALTVQNRVIRLEMRLRLRELLSGEALERSKALGTGQLIALRFASDAELPALVERTLKGEFATNKDIKRAIKDWQADFLRA